MSTSTVFTTSIQGAGFAPVTPKGLGIVYRVHDDCLGCNCSFYEESPNGGEFVSLVRKSLLDIQSVLEGKNFKY